MRLMHISTGREGGEDFFTFFRRNPLKRLNSEK